jgi:tetratricopeptide (TPR) repeat protein
MAYVAPMILRAIPVLPALMGVLALLTAPALAAPAKEAPITVESLLTQARAATAKGEIELALRLVQSAIVADPARPTSYVALGDIYAVSGQPDYARNFYDAALQIDPADAGALKAIAALDKTSPSTTANATR